MEAFVGLIVCLFPLYIYGSIVIFFKNSKSRLNDLEHIAGTCIYEYNYLKDTYCTELKNMKSVTRCNAILDIDGLPCAVGATRDWGEPFSFYTSLSGGKYHSQYGCCGATHGLHLYPSYLLSAKERAASFSLDSLEGIRALREETEEAYERGEITEAEYDERMDVLDAEASMAGESLFDERYFYVARTTERRRAISEETLCSHCCKNMPSDLFRFLELYVVFEKKMEKIDRLTNSLRYYIKKYSTRPMRFFYRRRMKEYQSIHETMLVDKEALRDEMHTQFRKGYLALDGAEFYRICYSKKPSVGTNPDAPFIAALKPVQNASDGSRMYQLLRLGFPNGGYILYDKDTYITPGKVYRLVGINKNEEEHHYVYLSKDSQNLLPPRNT